MKEANRSQDARVHARTKQCIYIYIHCICCKIWRDRQVHRASPAPTRSALRPPSTMTCRRWGLAPTAAANGAKGWRHRLLPPQEVMQLAIRPQVLFQLVLCLGRATQRDRILHCFLRGIVHCSASRQQQVCQHASRSIGIPFSGRREQRRRRKGCGGAWCWPAVGVNGWRQRLPARGVSRGHWA